MTEKKLIVITRSTKDNKSLKQKLKKKGFEVFEYPAIQISKNPLNADEENRIRKVKSYDWILFTSKNAVSFFMETLKDKNIDTSILKHKKIAVVGKNTAKKATEYNLKVSFMPSLFTKKALAEEIGNITGLKLLLAQGNLSGKTLYEYLKRKGGFPTTLCVYKTTYPGKNRLTKLFSFLVLKHKIYYILFTSPSTIKGFVTSLKKEIFFDSLLQEKIIVIGPTTKKEAQRQGFTNIKMAVSHTIEGVIKTIG